MNMIKHDVVSDKDVEDREKCFIIQPLDDIFKKRCEEHFKPAIEQAGLRPYRVDEHYDSAHLLRIDTIYEEIQNSSVCLADITRDNPNVWYEFGFADGKGIPVVLICEAQAREHLPFDVNQRDVFFYRAVSESERFDLREQITRRIRRAIKDAPRWKKAAEGQLSAILPRIQEFQNKRMEKIKNRQDLPVQLENDLPTVIFHIIPRHQLLEKERIDFSKTQPHELNALASGSHRRNVDGICWYDLNDLSVTKYAQIFETGEVECVEVFPHFQDCPPYLPNVYIAKELIWVLYSYIGNFKILNLGQPPWDLFLGLSLLNVKDYRFPGKNGSKEFRPMQADRPDVTLPLERKKILNESMEAAIAALRPSLNKLWSVFGYSQCSYDDEELKTLVNMG